MTLITGAATNSHLCSFVLTQFCPTHPLAHLIFFEGGQFWKFWFVGASRVKRPLTAPPTPFMRPTPSPLLCPKFLLKHLILSCKTLRKSFMACFTITFSACFQKKRWWQEFPRIAFGAGNGEHQVGGNGAHSLYVLHTLWAATTASMVSIKTSSEMYVAP